MLIYEKNNKLNINFENSVNESPDLQISKSGDKTEVLIDGQPGGGSGGGVLICTDTAGTLNKTMGEIQAAFLRNDRIILTYENAANSFSEMVSLDCVGYFYKEKMWVGSAWFARGTDVIEYRASEASEEAALAAYPTLNGD